MDSSFDSCSCAAAITFFTLLGTTIFMFYRKLIFQQGNIKIAVASSSSSLSSPPSSLSRNQNHHVFPSFHGADVRKSFLSHIMKEFERKGIDPFIDNDIERSKSITPELKEAIKVSRIAIVLLSRNYASSSWCLNELVKIMKYRKKLGLIVMTVFYEVDPTDVKKQAGDFGKAFKKTCKGKKKEDIEKWRRALEGVATIAGEHYHNWDNEAAMIEKIATDVSNMLNNNTPSRDFDGFIGMGAHIRKMISLLRMDLDEVRMIGIWGPPGIGKTTIARVLFNHLSKSFQLSVFMKELMYTRPVCSDDYSAKLQLQKQFMSEIINHKDIEIPHLGVVQDRLKDKKVLIVLDNVDQSIQLDAIAKETRWFGHGSRIIITTRDQKLLKAHDGVNDIYMVGFPSTNEACQIFCRYAFGQKFPKDGFGELVREVTKLLGELPLGLRIMGFYFRGMSKQEWINALPRLRNRLDGDIASILKFSYDALCDVDKDLFLHIACFFNHRVISNVEDHLAHKFLAVRHGLHVLGEKSLISVKGGRVMMHQLLVKLGREIVCHDPRKQSISEPGKRQFLVDAKDIVQVLADGTGSRRVTGIKFSVCGGVTNISERAFEKMPNLQFLKLGFPIGKLSDKLLYLLPQALKYLSKKLRLLHCDRFPMTCLPSNFCTEYLVELNMPISKLQMLWEGNRPLRKLKCVDLDHSKNLKELPDLSTATNLQRLLLRHCSSLVELPSSIGNAINLQILDLYGCSSLVELPHSIGNAANLELLNLSMCTGLLELPSSIGNLHKLQKLRMKGCSKLEVLPTDVNLESLDELDLTDCLMLGSFPEISTAVKHLKLVGTAIKEVPSSIKSWWRLKRLEISFNGYFKEFPHALDIITVLSLNDTEMQEIPFWVKKISRLQKLILSGCKNLVSLPQLSDSLSYLEAKDCESLERLDCSFHNPKSLLTFAKCFKLNKEARELIIQTSTPGAILPGEEVPMCFTHRATTADSLTIKLNERPPSTPMRFKACIILVSKGDKEGMNWVTISYRIMEKRSLGSVVPCSKHHHLPCYFSDHLYIFDFEAVVKSKEFLIEFRVNLTNKLIKECGVLQL